MRLGGGVYIYSHLYIHVLYFCKGGGGSSDWTYLVAWCGSDVRRGRVWSGDLAGHGNLARGTGSESLEG